MYVVDEYNWLERARQDDRPVHRVHLDAFYMDQYEVTNADYYQFTQATGRKGPYHWMGGRPSKPQLKLPVVNVDYDDARSYCSWVGKRLPTEAEWERGARGGLEKMMYSWGNDIGGPQVEVDADAVPEPKAPAPKTAKRAHYGFPDGPAPVGSYPKNGFGLYDMTGNVWEWTGDFSDREYYSLSPHDNPKGPESGTFRVIRGGSWADGDVRRQLTVNYRNFTDDFVKTTTLGFRCVKSAN